MLIVIGFSFKGRNEIRYWRGCDLRTNQIQINVFNFFEANAGFSHVEFETRFLPSGGEVFFRAENAAQPAEVNCHIIFLAR